MTTTVVALVIGVGLANIVQPGKLLAPEDRAKLLSSYGGSVGGLEEDAAKAPSLSDQLLGIVPGNPFNSLAEGEMLQIIFFALMLGIALTLMKPERSKLIVDVFDRLNDAMVMLVHVAMGLAPYGVAALLFKVVGSTGLSVLAALAVYGLVVVVGLLLHVFLMYGSVIKFGARLPVFQFLGAIKEALLVAFSTSSSSATLPVTKEACEDNVNISPKITSFVLPLGATVNMDGTALYQGVAAIFIAQIYGLDLSIGDQATIVLSATLASVGAAGVPGAGMITLAMVLTAVGVPTEGPRVDSRRRSAARYVQDNDERRRRLDGHRLHGSPRGRRPAHHERRRGRQKSQPGLRRPARSRSPAGDRRRRLSRTST